MDTIAVQVRNLFLPMFQAGQKDLPGAVGSLLRLLSSCRWIAMETKLDLVRFSAADGSEAEIRDERAFTKIRLPLSAIAMAFMRRTGRDEGDYIYAQHQGAHFTFDDGLDLWARVDLTNNPTEQSFRLERIEETPTSDTQTVSVQA